MILSPCQLYCSHLRTIKIHSVLSIDGYFLSISPITISYQCCGYFNFPRSYWLFILHLHTMSSLCVSPCPCQCSPSFPPCRSPLSHAVTRYHCGTRCEGVRRWGLSEGELRNSLPPSFHSFPPSFQDTSQPGRPRVSTTDLKLPRQVRRQSLVDQTDRVE